MLSAILFSAAVSSVSISDGTTTFKCGLDQLMYSASADSLTVRVNDGCFNGATVPTVPDVVIAPPTTDPVDPTTVTKGLVRYVKDGVTHVIFDRGASLEMFIPRCVPTEYANCKYGSSRSKYDTILDGEVWSMRIPYAPKGTEQLATYIFDGARTETGEATTPLEMSFSREPGDFDVAPACKLWSAKVYDASLGTPRFATSYCPMTDGPGMYYLNVRTLQPTTNKTFNCDKVTPCRIKFLWPAVFPWGS